MSAGGWINLAGITITFLTALIGLFQGRRNQTKISEVHILVNQQLADFKLDQAKILETSVKEAHAAGKVEGAAEVKAGH